jgi:hypothetical protein
MDRLDRLGERSSPTEFAWLLNRFYKVATDTLVRYDAVISTSSSATR